MRALLIVLMIALLPLRAWAGHVMAVDMAAQQVLVAHAAAQKPGPKQMVSMDTAMPADCIMFSKVSPPGATSPDTGTPINSGLQCNSCDTCELCLALATSTHAEWPTGTGGMHSAPVVFGTGFSSADRSSSLKPPIS